MEKPLFKENPLSSDALNTFLRRNLFITKAAPCHLVFCFPLNVFFLRYLPLCSEVISGAEGSANREVSLRFFSPAVQSFFSALVAQDALGSNSYNRGTGAGSPSQRPKNTSPIRTSSALEHEPEPFAALPAERPQQEAGFYSLSPDSTNRDLRSAPPDAIPWSPPELFAVSSDSFVGFLINDLPKHSRVS